MTGKGGKSGQGARGGNLGVRGVGGGVGKRLLKGKSVRVVGGEVALRGSQEKEWEVFEGLVEVKGGWENNEVFIRQERGVIKKEIGQEKGVGGKEEVEKMWEEGDMVMGLEDGKTMEGDGLGDSKFAKMERSLEAVRKSVSGLVGESKGKGKEVKREKIESVVVVEEEEEGEGVDSLEAWKLKRRRKERI